MKRFIATVCFLTASQAMMAMAGVNLNVNIGSPPPQPPAIVVSPPTYAPPPVEVQQPPPVVFEEQPRFIFLPALGFYVSVGTPYDIMYIGQSYYLHSGRFWYVGPTFSGPWAFAQGRLLPAVLHRYRYDQIRNYRDTEYRVYRHDPAHYRGRVYEPAWKPREPHREGSGEHRGEGRRDERP
jgi:hypothetical protein